MSTAEPIASAQKKVLVAGNQQSGWWPVTGEQTEPVRVMLLNFEIQFDGSGYLLCYSSEGALLYGDSWHVSENEARQAALEEFGVQPNEWRHA
ncbi:MAG: hypothetical protein KKE51_12395 [Gammaproteobacteria bacterium]|jgi:hypothetical protein|nr:hypothetical protein [Gammaproteobacteria bacterium]MBU2432009.1 hypothetical protein [Gammaproteobacteria bacterium]MBU2449012.1 hypothetical protein [Gammaproteobacteria bacterium]